MPLPANNRAMAIGSKQSARPFFLGIEGGGTRTVALMADADGSLLNRFEAGPGELRLLKRVEPARVFGAIPAGVRQQPGHCLRLAGAAAGRGAEGMSGGG